jgi:hypothetical protein
MRAKRFVSVLALCLLAAGCNIYKYSAYNMITTPTSTGNEACNLAQNCRAAEAAWKEEQGKACAEANYSKDYACGFKDGYADFLDYGGTGLPPATPPFRYRTTCYQTPDGHTAIEDYNAGFAHGAAAARASGLRNLKVLPGMGVGLPPGIQELYEPPPWRRDGAAPATAPEQVLPAEPVPVNVLPAPGGLRPATAPSGFRPPTARP